jgi:GNAT superfamily N-acetyltransferase
MINIVVRSFDLIKKGKVKFLINGIAKRLFSKNIAFGLKRDLNLLFQNPDALIDISIRPFRNTDKDHFTADLRNDGLIEKNIPNCYVAANTEDIPCFRIWLIGPNQNLKIKEFWGEYFPVLKEDEALLESAFTVPAYRGNRIMSAAISRMAEKESDLGIRRVISYVAIDNIPSLKGFHRSGFHPYLLRKEKWFMFKRTVTFENIPKKLIDTYSKSIITKKSY